MQLKIIITLLRCRFCKIRWIFQKGPTNIEITIISHLHHLLGKQHANPLGRNSCKNIKRLTFIWFLAQPWRLLLQQTRFSIPSFWVGIGGDPLQIAVGHWSTWLSGPCPDNPPTCHTGTLPPPYSRHGNQHHSRLTNRSTQCATTGILMTKKGACGPRKLGFEW